MRCGFAVGLFLFDLSLILRLRLYSVHFFSFYIVIYRHSANAGVQTQLPATWVFLFSPFCSRLFSLFAKTSHVPPKPSFPTHSPKQRTVLSCSSLQMPVTARSPMVCEQVVCPAPLLSSANEWTPSTWCNESDLWWTYTSKNVSHCLDPVYDDVCLFTFIILPFSIVSLCFISLFMEVLWLAVLKSEIWTVGDYEYAHMWTLFVFLFPYTYLFLTQPPFSQGNNLMELWRTIRTKVKSWFGCPINLLNL